jgi:hypothetical protein
LKKPVWTYKADMSHLFLPFLGHMGQTKKINLKNVADFKLTAEDANIIFLYQKISKTLYPKSPLSSPLLLRILGPKTLF